MFAYASLERIVAQAHGIETAKELASFGSRLKHLQKLGMFRISPGKGQKIEYSLDDVFFWGLCFELVEVGLPPMLLHELMPRLITIKAGQFINADSLPLRLYLIIGCQFYQMQTKGHSMRGGYLCRLANKKQVDEALEDVTVGRIIVINLFSLQCKLIKGIECEKKGQLFFIPSEQNA